MRVVCLRDAFNHLQASLTLRPHYVMMVHGMPSRSRQAREIKKKSRLMLTGFAQLALASFSTHPRDVCCITNGDTEKVEGGHLKPPGGMVQFLSIC